MRAIAALLVLALLVPALAGPADAAQPRQDVTLDIELTPDGHAEWNVSARVELDSANETAAFRRLGERFESGDLDGVLSADLFRTLAEQSAERTGREMRITDVNRSATVRNRSASAVGVLTLRFRWTNFASVTDDGIAVRDALGPGFEIRNSQTVRLSPPPNYAIDSLAPTPTSIDDGGVIRWNGPAEFGDGLTVTYVPKSALTSTTTTTTTTPGGDITLGTALVGGLFIGALVIVVVLGAYGVRVHDTVFGWLSRVGGDDAETDADDEGDPEQSEPAEPTGEGDDERTIDEALLSDEERVELLLERNGGRMRQANIVSETGWSNAKVSQLLSSMAEDGRVEKLQMGRENLISLPDDEET
jgi:uncharacterized membrane protein